MRKRTAFILALLFYASILPWNVKAAYFNYDVNNLVVKTSPYIDVRAYGAVGDGVTDDATAIDNAMNACSEAGGGTVLIPEGTFLLGTVSTRTGTSNSYIVPKDNCNVIGVGEGSVLKIKAAENVRLAPGGPRVLYTTADLENVIFRDFVIDGNGQNNLMDGVLADQNHGMISSEDGGGINILIENITFKNQAGNNAIAFNAGSNGIIVQNCRFEEMGSGISGNVSTDHSDIYLLGSNNKVINNYFKSSLHVDGAAWENHGIDFEASGNYVNGYSVPFWLTTESGNSRTTDIHNNVFDNVWSAGSFSYVPAYNNGFGRVYYRNNYVAMAAEAEAGGTSYFFYGPGDTADYAEELEISGNTIIGVAGTAVEAIRAVYTRNVNIVNNYIKNFAKGFSFSTGDLGDGYGHHSVYVQGNTFDNLSGSNIYASSGTLKVMNIQNNTFISGTNLPINLSSTPDRGIISGNMVDNTFLYDIDTGSGMGNVFIDHHLTTAWAGQGWVGGYMALGSRLYRKDTPIVYDKIVAGTLLRRTINDNDTSAYTCDTDHKGDRVLNTGTDNVATWYCNGTAWVEK